MIGKLYETKNFGTVKIIDSGNKYNYYKVEFLQTGTIDEFRRDAIIYGEIRDKYAPSFLGIGIIGNVTTKRENSKYYSIWRNMLNRCYNPKSKNANSYYGKVTVCKDWIVFEKFLRDIKDIDGWNEELFNANMIVLDKDKKQRFQENKVYSLNTCTWLSTHENNKYQDYQQRKFIAISPDGTEYIDYNISDFAKNHNLGRRQISAVLHGRFKSTQNWHFKYLDKDIV